MISGTVFPSAADRSLTVTPDGTATGPVAGAAGCFGWRGSWRSRACRGDSRGRAAGLSITTRRPRRPVAAPLPGPVGRFGLLEPLATRVSGEPCPSAIDPDGRLPG